jgi:hypothetical protein
MMPDPDILSDLAKEALKSQGKQVASGWAPPQGDAGKQFAQSIKPGDRNVAADDERVFRPVSSNRFHVDAAINISQKFEAYLERMCSAIANGWGTWMSESSIQGVVVIGAVGTVLPGTVMGPGLDALIMTSDPPVATPQERQCSMAIARTLGAGWSEWASQLEGAIPCAHCGVFPGPMAPPLPNVPVPVSTLVSSGSEALSKPRLAEEMSINYEGSGHFAQDIFDAVSEAFSLYFPTWQSETNVVNVLAGGPVPSFAPPVVPAGPVIGGVGVGAACFL